LKTGENIGKTDYRATGRLNNRFEHRENPGGKRRGNVARRKPAGINRNPFGSSRPAAARSDSGIVSPGEIDRRYVFAAERNWDGTHCSLPNVACAP